MWHSDTPLPIFLRLPFLNCVLLFQGQSIDFFGALRARVYDDAIRELIQSVGMDKLGKRLVNPTKEEGPVVFQKPQMAVATLLQYGRMLEAEQENVKRVQLADEYLDGAALAGKSGSANTQESANFECAHTARMGRQAGGLWWPGRASRGSAARAVLTRAAPSPLPARSQVPQRVELRVGRSGGLLRGWGADAAAAARRWR